MCVYVHLYTILTRGWQKYFKLLYLILEKKSIIQIIFPTVILFDYHELRGHINKTETTHKPKTENGLEVSFQVRHTTPSLTGRVDAQPGFAPGDPMLRWELMLILKSSSCRSRAITRRRQSQGQRTPLRR